MTNIELTMVHTTDLIDRTGSIVEKEKTNGM
jgi:hypothetical protein